MSTLATKYTEKIARARVLVAKYGSNSVVWNKAPDAPNPDNPQFPTPTTPVQYLVDFALIPLTRLSELTSGFDVKSQLPDANFAGIMAGGIPFTPAVQDVITFPDGSTHSVLYINITGPDGVPVVFEVYTT